MVTRRHYWYHWTDGYNHRYLFKFALYLIHKVWNSLRLLLPGSMLSLFLSKEMLNYGTWCLDNWFIHLKVLSDTFISVYNFKWIIFKSSLFLKNNFRTFESNFVLSCDGTFAIFADRLWRYFNYSLGYEGIDSKIENTRTHCASSVFNVCY